MFMVKLVVLKKTILLGALILALFLRNEGICQSTDFARDISPIVFQKCTPCHRAGDIGPMPFTGYTEVKEYAKMIRKVILSGYMPPWYADTSCHFANQITLNSAEVKLISDWVEQGTKAGDTLHMNSWKYYFGNVDEAKPSLVLCMEQSYRVKGDLKDNYREFVLKPGLKEDKYISAVRFLPGNTRVVHHAWVLIDEQRLCRHYDELDTAYGYDAFSRMFTVPLQKMPGYLPGLTKNQYPASSGILLKKEADLIIQIHYAPSSKTEFDSSCIELFFTDKPVERPVQFFQLTEFDLPGITQQDAMEVVQHGNISALSKYLDIPAGEVRTFTEKTKAEMDMSLISLIPHMHYRGRKFHAFAVTPQKDTIELVSISNWNFDWQNAYIFSHLLHVPKGSLVYATGEFDNTASNPSNPVVPPREATFGFGSKSEMLELSGEFLIYKEGDELISAAPLHNLGVKR